MTRLEELRAREAQYILNEMDLKSLSHTFVMETRRKYRAAHLAVLVEEEREAFENMFSDFLGRNNIRNIGLFSNYLSGSDGRAKSPLLIAYILAAAAVISYEKEIGK